ncbi:MAG: hypothetical protein AAFR88_05540 [Pseudomonadota bacterium]
MSARGIKRRIFAAVILILCATGSVFFWNRGSFDLFEFSFNLGVAGVGFLVLHHRWKAKEARELTPGKVEDIFS